MIKIKKAISESEGYPKWSTIRLDADDIRALSLDQKKPGEVFSMFVDVTVAKVRSAATETETEMESMELQIHEIDIPSWGLITDAERKRIGDIIFEKD